LALAKEGLRKIEENERKKQQELEEAERKKRVEELLQEAREFVKERRIELAESRFSEIAMIDPDNIEVPRLKLDIENWKKDIARKELEEAQKKAERSAKVQKLQPGKTLFSQKEWFKAVAELEKFLKIEDMDDDLRKEGETMYDTAKNELSSTVNPLLGKARSLVEGQDLKGAYETYFQILKIDPSNTEALNQTTDIKEQLTNKARKIYREAIISESLSLFQDAKEKFQEVQQISPVDSDYYKKATEKLKNYLE
jgi:tetratricopeptide (TPR) repeat protein